MPSGPYDLFVSNNLIWSDTSVSITFMSLRLLPNKTLPSFGKMAFVSSTEEEAAKNSLNSSAFSWSALWD